MFVTEVSTCAASRGSDFFQRQGTIIYIHFSLSENIKNIKNPDITGINER